MKQRKISYSYRESNPDRQAHSLSLYWLSCPGKEKVAEKHKDVGQKHYLNIRSWDCHVIIRMKT
jgi:hypothetical protein